MRNVRRFVEAEPARLVRRVAYAGGRVGRLARLEVFRHVRKMTARSLQGLPIGAEVAS